MPASGSASGTARALERDRARLERSSERLAVAPRLLLERRRSALDRSAARLQALSPRATLARGYAIVRAGGAVVRDAGTVAAGELVEIELAARRPRCARRGGAPVSEQRSFEELQRELDELVARLERGDVPLDEALALWRRGEELHRACVERLDRAELEIEELRAGRRLGT